MKKRFRNMLEYIMLTTTVSVFKILPFKSGKKILPFLFRYVGMWVVSRKKIALTQLRESFPNKSNRELSTILHKTYYHFGYLAADLFLSKNDRNKQIDVQGWENITESLQLERGLLLISGHIGNWELAGRYISSQNIPISVVVKQLHNLYVNDYINRIRMKNGIKIIYKKKALRPTIKAFKNNEALVTLIDQDARMQGVKLPFLGREASLFTGFVRLALLYDTPLVFGVALRNDDGSYSFIFEKPVIPSQYKTDSAINDNTELELEIAKYFHGRLEEYVKRYPEQWFWLHNRWKGAKKARQIV